MSTMTANFRVATPPVQIPVARDSTAEKESSGNDERFSNLLSERRAARDEAPPQHAAAPKPKEPAKPKESKPDDTLHLLHRSSEIQPSVTPPPQGDQTAQTQAQPAAEAVDDVVSATSAKPAVPTVVALPILTTDPAVTDATATVASTPAAQTPTLHAALSQIDAATTVTTQPIASQTANAAAKPQVDVPKTPVTDAAKKTTLAAQPSTKTAVPLQGFKPIDLSANTPADSADAQPTDVTPTQIAATPAPVPTATLPQTDAPTVTVDTPKPADTMTLQQQPAIPSSQLDFSNATPIVIASAVAAAVRHADLRADSSDDSIGSVDSTSPTGTVPTFSLHESHDIATADGKTPVPAPSSPEFGDALGAKLSWMAERHIGHAEIRLSPDNLGAVDVHVHLNGDRVRAEFNAANPEVRQAINDHIPRLRDMLSRSGFDLAESHVGNGSNPQNSPSSQPGYNPATVEDDTTTLPAPRIPAYTHDGILDAFA